jgi:spore coat polysaccharide biosynthesis protein SpsF
MSVPQTIAPGVLVFARMSSSRLPGKVLMPFHGMPLVCWILQRARTLNLPVALATSNDSSDDALAQVVRAAGYDVMRGALHDVLERALHAAQQFGFTHFARLCADRPLFSLDEMRRGLQAAAKEPTVDLHSNLIKHAAPMGLTSEIIRTQALAQAAKAAALPQQREHLTRYFYDHANAFSLRDIVQEKLPSRCHGMGFAVDTAQDYERLLALTKGCSVDVALPDLLGSEPV